MTNEELNKKVKSAFTDIAPDSFQQILSDSKIDKGSVVLMTTNKRNNFKKFAAVAAAFVILFAGVIGFAVTSQRNDIVSTVSLDVNPSINIQLNKNEKIVDVIPLNEDAEKIVGTMDFKGSDLTVTVNALVGSMLRNGYLSDIANSLLVTVEGNDHAFNEQMRKRVEDEIDAVLKGVDFDASILNQEIDEEDKLEAFAEKNGISEGKAKLVFAIAEELPHHTPEELAKLSINELNILAGNTEEVTAKGEPSTKGYIGTQKATKIALDKIGIKESDTISINVTPESDDGVMVYEVVIQAGNYIYEVEIDATTGNVSDFEKELVEGPFELPSEPDSSVINEAEAKAAAYAKAGVNGADVKGCKVEFDREDNVYEVEFYAGGYEYNVDINAASGKVVDFDKEYDDDYNEKPVNKPVATTAANPTPSQISAEAAKSNALKYAGVSESGVTNYRSKLTTDDGVKVYEIEFNCNGYEYDVEVNASTGKVTDFDKERIDDNDDNYNKPAETTKKPAAAENYIGKDKAKTIALNRAGVSASEIKGCKCEFDKDDGVAVYEIEFKVGKYEYSAEINAKTGAVIDFEKEIDD